MSAARLDGAATWTPAPHEGWHTLELWCWHCDSATEGIVAAGRWYCKGCGCSKPYPGEKGETKCTD